MGNDLLQRAHDHVQRLAAVDQALAQDAAKAEHVRSTWDPQSAPHQLASAWRASTDAHRDQVAQAIADMQAQGTALARLPKEQGTGRVGLGDTTAATAATSPLMKAVVTVAVVGAAGLGGWYLWKRYGKKVSRKENPVVPMVAEPPALPAGRTPPRFHAGERLNERYHRVTGRVVAVQWSEVHSVWAYKLDCQPAPMWVYDHPQYLIRHRGPEPELEEEEEEDEEEEETP